jgi:hypothetical protein
VHETESNELVNCVVCGAEMSLQLDRSFAVTGSSGLCFGCAVARGGRYDASHDTWTRAPDLTGVPAIDL